MAKTSSDFSAMKKSRGNQLEILNKELSKLNPQAPNSSDDSRFWYPETDKAGNGYAIIRFLPAPQGEDVPFVRVWDHGFKGPTGKWYIEKSLTTLGQKDPVSEYNSMLWATGLDSNKKIVREQKRRLSFYSNIKVIKDSAHPENEGKNFLFKYGKKIFDKVNAAMHPEFEDEKPINPFDFWEGADFKIKIRQVEGYRNYDSSEFANPAPLSEDDAELEALWKKEFSLKEFIDPASFKSYTELKEKLDSVLGLDGSGAKPTQKEPEALPPRGKVKAPRADAADAVDGDEADLSFFRKIAEDETD